jgi:hypothetical protein
MDKIVEVLVNQWLYDISVLSDPWVLYTVAPAVFYSIFMVLKWAVLTIPVWVPLSRAINFGGLVKKVKNEE